MDLGTGDTPQLSELFVMSSDVKVAPSCSSLVAIDQSLWQVFKGLSENVMESGSQR